MSKRRTAQGDRAFTVGLLLGNATACYIAAVFTFLFPDVTTLWAGFATAAVIFSCTLFGMTTLARATGAA